jgi:hypothetical protein
MVQPGVLLDVVNGEQAAAGVGHVGWFAGSVGHPPSPASVVLTLTALVATFAAVALGARPRRRREAPLRQQMGARPVTFRAGVDVKANILGIMLPTSGPFNLIVHGDAIRVSNPFPPARLLLGYEYCYRAEDTTIKAVAGLSHDWIEIEGQPTGTAARIQIGRRNTNRQIWDALVHAGAQPIGVGPAEPGGLTTMAATTTCDTRRLSE